ncbi:MAG: DUF1351 domain-containing protein, partial [Campylobacterota bacterium]|nr:DUF1351 domain-containing protein [Campylobacterota bacterium]
MNNLDLKISSTPPTINGNFEEIKKELEQQLKQFDLIVDADSIKVAKKMATSINKASGQIDTLRKEEVAKLLTPIKDFEEEAKTLTALCQESRQKLLSQVKVFEDEQRVECKRLLDLELVATYEKYGVKEEFQTITVADLAIISNLNKTGIAKKAITAIDERVLEAKRFQEKIDLRLLTLEAICFKGGLLAPLTRENINHFLMEKDDEIYLEKLTKLITNEVTRIELMNERIREKETTAAVAKVAPPVAQV